MQTRILREGEEWEAAIQTLTLKYINHETEAWLWAPWRSWSTHLMDLGCQATFDRFFRGYERFYTCAARHPTGILWARKGTWASGTWDFLVMIRPYITSWDPHLTHISVGGWCFSKNHLTEKLLSAWLYYLNIQFNSWSKFMGGRKVAVSLHPMKPRHFPGWSKVGWPMKHHPSGTFRSTLAGSWHHRCKRVPNETLVFGDAKGST